MKKKRKITKTKKKKAIKQTKHVNGRKASGKDKNSKVTKLKRLARARARKQQKKSFFARLFGK